MEQSPSWEANWFSASQEIPCILWNLKFITAFTSALHLSLSCNQAKILDTLHEDVSMFCCCWWYYISIKACSWSDVATGSAGCWRGINITHTCLNVTLYIHCLSYSLVDQLHLFHIRVQSADLHLLNRPSHMKLFLDTWHNFCHELLTVPLSYIVFLFLQRM